MAATIEFNWNDDPVKNEMYTIADEALAMTAYDVALEAKINPPYWLGNYQRSIRVIEPGYEGDDFFDAQQGDLLSNDLGQLMEEIVDHEVSVGSFLPYSARIQAGARDADKRFNLIRAAEARGTQEHYEYNLYLAQRRHGI